MEDYYAVVGVDRTASPDEIDQAIRQQLRIWQRRAAHRDLGRRQAAERRVQLLSDARSVLLDEAGRRRYDQQLGLPPGDQVAVANPDAVHPIGSELASREWPAAASFSADLEAPIRPYAIVGAGVLGLWYLTRLGALFVTVPVAVDLFAICGLLVVTAGFAASQLPGGRTVVLHIDDQTITLHRATRLGRVTSQTTYYWDDIRKVTVREPLGKGAGRVVLAIEGHRPPGAGLRGGRWVRLGPYRMPIAGVRDALARFAGPRLCE